MKLSDFLGHTAAAVGDEALRRHFDHPFLLEVAPGLPEGDRRLFPVRGPRALVGRGADCDVRILDPYVSGRHAELVASEGDAEPGWRVVDVGSTHGTRIDGDAVVSGAARAVRSGAVLELGRQARFELLGAAELLERLEPLREAAPGGDPLRIPTVVTSPPPRPPEAPRPRVDAAMLLLCPPLDPVPIRPGRAVVVGRLPAGADLVLAHANVSRRHASFAVEGDAVVVRDLDSSNGTFVGLAPIGSEPVRLEPGDVVGIGPYELRLARPNDLLADTDGEGLAPLLVLEGTLEETPLEELLGRIESQHLTGALELGADGAAGRIQVKGGAPCDAWAGELRGPEAIRRLVAVRRGPFRLRREPVNDEAQPITRSFSKFLLQGLVRSAADAPGGRRGDAHLRDVLDQMLDGIVCVDDAGRIEFVNGVAVEIFGYDEPAELVGRPVGDLVPEPLRSRGVELLTEGVVGLTRELVGVRRDGGVFPLELAVGELDHGDRRGLLGVVRDLTEKKRVEEDLARSQEALRQSQKLEAVGRLAGGVAHDFNNLLTVILGTGEQLLAGGGLDPKRRRKVERIDAAAQRAARLTAQLLTLSRRQVQNPRRIDLNAVLGGVDEVLAALLGAQVTLDLDLADAPVWTTADPHQLEQVITNLFVNARDAMPDGGRIRCRTGVVTSPSDMARAEVPPGDYVFLSVEDDGCGMDAETLACALEPFFTTKGSEGTGLGLPIVYGIVKQTGGGVAIDSAPDAGTRIDVLLPRAAPPAPGAPPSTRAVRARTRRLGGGTVLLVDDEDLLRDLAEQSLVSAGYRVRAAADAAGALALARAEGARFDVIVSDVVLPDQSGVDLVARLRALHPDAEVLLISGYTAGAEVAGERFLAKPFRPAELVAAVTDALAERGGPEREGGEPEPRA